MINRGTFVRGSSAFAGIVSLFLSSFAAHADSLVGSNYNTIKMRKLAPEIMALTDEQLLAMVPDQTPFITADCPGGNQNKLRGPDKNAWTYYPPTATSPSKIVCVGTGKAFPGDFPLNFTKSFYNTKHELIEIKYYQDPNGNLYALPGMLQSFEHDWLEKHITALSYLYKYDGGNEQYAHRVALLLGRYAEVFPHYLTRYFGTDVFHPTQDTFELINHYTYVSTGGPYMSNGVKKAETPKEPEASDMETVLPYQWTENRWGWGRWGEGFPVEFVDAYERIQSSPSMTKDLYDKLIAGLFGEAYDWLITYPFYYHTHTNASSHIAQIINAGRVLGQPEWVHFGYRWTNEVLQRYVFSREHIFGESPGYFYVFLSTQENNFPAIDGYIDPPGYVGKEDGLHFGTPLSSKYAFDFLAKARNSTEMLRFPNGSDLPLGDNRHDTFVIPNFRVGRNPDGTALRGEVRQNSESLLMPGYGHAVLGSGTGDQQIQAHLHFSQFNNVAHTHRDGLSMMLWAFGSEYFTDIGYHKDLYRLFSASTLAHNTVTVNRTEQAGEHNTGSVTLYQPEKDGISLVQVEDKGAYEDVTSRYRRTLILNSRDLGHPYVVDVFEVTGGTTHDYALHGPTLYESEVDTNIHGLAPMAGERPLLEGKEKGTGLYKDSPYGAFSNVSQAPASNGFYVTFKLKDPYDMPVFNPSQFKPEVSSMHYEADPATYAKKLALGVRTHFVEGEAGRTLFMAETPSLLRSGLEGSSLTEKLKRPSLILRNRGADGLSSVFVTVHEPYYGGPGIISVKNVSVPENAKNTVAIEVTSHTGVDTFLLSLDDAQVVRTSNVEMNGRFGFVSTSNAGKTSGLLLGGTKLSKGSLNIASTTASFTGIVRSVRSVHAGARKNALLVSGSNLPNNSGVLNSLKDRWVNIKLGIKRPGAAPEAVDAFQIDHAEYLRGMLWLYLKDDPEASLKSAVYKETQFPRRSFSGYVYLDLPVSLSQ